MGNSLIRTTSVKGEKKSSIYVADSDKVILVHTFNAEARVLQDSAGCFKTQPDVKRLGREL